MDFEGKPEKPPHFDTLLRLDGYLSGFENAISKRYGVFSRTRARIERDFGGYDHFTAAYNKFGLIVQPDNSVSALEWAPGADALFLLGDFNGWNRMSHPYNKLEYGKWSLTLPPNADGSCAIPHLSVVKVMVCKDGHVYDKLSPWAHYVQRPKDSVSFHQVFYNPPEKYILKVPKPKRPRAFRIYETHVGISSWEGKVASYRHFADNIVPRIKKQGYNSIQLMAVMEHAYYASFGYQVTSFFAASSRCGTPDDLKYMVDKAHAAGLFVLLDVVHSHASKNTADGLNQWDGTNGCYFHNNQRGFHDLWDSRLFNYSELEVLRFLLSNLRWWLDEFGFDGFRFDGVTSMLYHSHGMGHGFGGGYDDYFGPNADMDSGVYLMLANDAMHQLFPEVYTVAEDVSGMPALCRGVSEGGLGFDARLAMAIPDMWIKLLKHEQDENWDMGAIVHTLENRRCGECCVAYAESHDQALVGDKTLAFWLMDAQMYTNMSCMSEFTPVVERGIALHKMIRLVTHALGGEAWLNFMGNEFGHPEWLDFPRVGNQESYHYARRQWNLVDDELLRYKFLNLWDQQMNECEEKYHWLDAGPAYVSWKHNGDKMVVFDRGVCVFVFNFHQSQSFTDYKVGAKLPGTYMPVLRSDDNNMGGQGRVNADSKHVTYPHEYAGRPNHFCVYVPARTCAVYAKVE